MPHKNLIALSKDKVYSMTINILCEVHQRIPPCCLHTLLQLSYEAFLLHYKNIIFNEQNTIKTHKKLQILVGLLKISFSQSCHVASMKIKSQVENSKFFVLKTKMNWCGDEKKKGETINDPNMKVDMYHLHDSKIRGLLLLI